MDHSQYGSRIVYPRMPEPLTESDLAGLFTVSPEEDHWARTVARKGPSLAVLLTHLKVFQHVGRFLPIAELPVVAMSFVVAQSDWRCHRTLVTTVGHCTDTTAPFGNS